MNTDRAPRFYVLTGSSGGGKSTLIEALAARGHAVVREAGRELVRELHSIGSPVEPGSELFGHLLFSRSMYLYNLALKEHGLDTPVFFDRSVIEPLAWRHEQGTMDAHHHRAVARFSYARTVFMAPPWPEIYVQDAERQRPWDPGQQEYRRLSAALPAFGYNVVELPRVSVADRVIFVEDHIREAR